MMNIKKTNLKRGFRYGYLSNDVLTFLNLNCQFVSKTERVRRVMKYQDDNIH